MLPNAAVIIYLILQIQLLQHVHYVQEYYFKITFNQFCKSVEINYVKIKHK